jgi:hypothetical protein
MLANKIPRGETVRMDIAGLPVTDCAALELESDFVGSDRTVTDRALRTVSRSAPEALWSPQGKAPGVDCREGFGA